MSSQTTLPLTTLSPERENPYAFFLDQVEKPARYIGGEHFILRKSWDQIPVRVALCFPDAYEIGVGHLGYKILYNELNRQEDILAERVYTPWPDMEAQLRERQLPLVSLENFRPLKDFQILGFSLQYELSYTNILTMLDLGGVPIFQKDRAEGDAFVVVGGPCSTHPEPLAPFIDIAVVGDGEDIFVRLARFVDKKLKEKIARKDILKELAHWPGIYVPSLYKTSLDARSGLEVVVGPCEEGLPKKIQRFIVEDINDYPYPVTPPIAHISSIFDNYSVELARGCTEGCRFCQAGMIYRPVRERKPDTVVEAVVKGLKSSGAREASLTCLSTADYSAVTPLLLDLIDKVKEDRSTLGIASLRAYGLDREVFDKLAESQNNSLTFAPEAGTERMRKVINKNITEEDMLQTAREVFGRGWRKMKLYFMIGLPTESDEDVAGIMETGKKARAIARELGIKNPAITISVSSFVPKPHTPFQWAPMIKLTEIERKQGMLFRLAKDYGLNFRKHVSKASFMEGIVARGDRRVGDVIYKAWKGGARFDGWGECFQFDTWMQALESSQVDPAWYLGTLPLDGALPWSHIDVGLKDNFLSREWVKATKDRLSPPCGKPFGAKVHHNNLQALKRTHEEEKKKLVCYHCGIKCDLKGMVTEREDYLISMGALENRPYNPPQKVEGTLAPGSRLKREKRGQNLGQRYRIQFSKLGPLSFIGHLDLQKLMARIFKRAGVKVLYSEGFNQRPLLSFGPALSLGVSSLAEYFDVRVPFPYENPLDLLDKLAQASERGIQFKKIWSIEKKDPSIQEAITSFSYFIPVDNKREEILPKIGELEKQREILLKTYRAKTKDYKIKNIRPLLGSLEEGKLGLDNSEQKELIGEVSPRSHEWGVLASLSIGSGPSLRPKELQFALEKVGLKTHRPIKIQTTLLAGH